MDATSSSLKNRPSDLPPPSDREILREARREQAFNIALKEGAIGLAGGIAGGSVLHFGAQQFFKPYQSLNWRAKLFIVAAAGVAGFSIRAEEKILEFREANSKADEAREAQMDQRRAARR